MDNNNFEQQFTQNLKAMPMQPAETGGSSKLPLVISVALAAIVIVQSIALILTLTNYFSMANSTEYADYEEEPVVGDTYNDSDYIYDNEDNLTAVNITCTNTSGASIKLTTDNKYQLGSDSGTYTIMRDSIIPITGSDGSKKVLYYDGIIIADGTTIYDCDTAETESTTE